nr:LCP family protein [Oceanobacillus polygoni]
MLKKIVLIVVTVLVVGGVATGSYAWNLFTSAITNIEEEIDNKKSEKRLQSIDLSEGDPISVLLVGIDEPEGKEDIYRRSDTLIYLTLDPHTKTTHMVSIPRDTLTEIVGHGEKDKINHSYAFGGIEVTNSFEFTQDDFTFEEGPIHLGGEEALSYIRMRKEDPKGDFGRQERQRQVIQSFLEKGSTLPGLTSSITNFEEIITSVEDSVRTNLGLKQMWDIQSNYRDALRHIEEHEIEGKETEKNKTFYYIPDEDKLGELSEELNGQLEGSS